MRFDTFFNGTRGWLHTNSCMSGAFASARGQRPRADDARKNNPGAGLPQRSEASCLNGNAQDTSGLTAASTECQIDMGQERGEFDSCSDVGGRSIEKDLERSILEVSVIKPWTPDDFVCLRKLQDALRNHGTVELMQCTGIGGNFVAVKRMPNRWMTSGPREFSEKYPKSSEKPWFDLGLVNLLHSQGFPYVCELHGVFQDSKITYVVSALASEGDLFTWCDALADVGEPREAKMKPIARQVLSAVAWLHDLGISHRDLSLENILLSKEEGKLQVKLIDYGMGTVGRNCCNEIRGKQSYQAPEMHAPGGAYDGFLTDAFALGVIMFCLASQDYPWQSTQPGRCQLFQYVSAKGFRAFIERRKLRKGSGQRLVDVFTESLVALIEGLVALKPNDRLTLGERSWRKRGEASRPSVWDMGWLDDWGK